MKPLRLPLLLFALIKPAISGYINLQMEIPAAGNLFTLI